MRGKQLIQTLQVLDLLSGQNGTTIPELMETLDITRRSVERLLVSMQNSDFPIYKEKEDGEKLQRWYLIDSYVNRLPNTTVPNLNLTLPELICLYLTKKDDPVFKGTSIEKWTNSVYGKLSLLCPEEIKPDLDRIRQLQVTKKAAFKAYKKHEVIIHNIANAIINQETIRIVYNTFSQECVKEAEIHPLHLFEDFGGLYMIARRSTDNEIRTYAVERIREMSKTHNDYEYPKNFCPDAYLEKTFGIIDDGSISVKVQFSSDQARYITEREWVPGQSIETLEDGSVVLAFSTRGKRDVKKWILGWGNDATVLEPEELREEIRNEMQQMLRKYE